MGQAVSPAKCQNMFEYRRRCGNCKSLWGTVENLFLIRSLGGCQITPSVSAGTVSPAPRPRADAWGYLDRQWIGFHHTLVGRRPIATGWKPAADCQSACRSFGISPSRPINNRPRVYNLSQWACGHKSVMKTNPLTVQITPSVSAGMACGRNRPLADAWGYLAAQVTG